MQNDNGKSDVKAKDAYKKHLESEGYEDIKIISSPSDITATKNGDIYYFEIKKTSQRESYLEAVLRSSSAWVSLKYLFFTAKSKAVSPFLLVAFASAPAANNNVTAIGFGFLAATMSGVAGYVLL